MIPGDLVWGFCLVLEILALPWLYFAHFHDSELPGQLMLATLQNDQELLAQLPSLSR